ncbi:hypothetical protein [Planococcus rifietoensis]|uniref:hypothetical protein n=1 Tax=Planococcus rifietoensis TaxID=200991 RepID=UPI00384D0656
MSKIKSSSKLPAQRKFKTSVQSSPVSKAFTAKVKGSDIKISRDASSREESVVVRDVNSRGLVATSRNGRQLGTVKSHTASSAGQVVVGKRQNRRTGPKGKLAIVSDGAVESISKDMEKRTRSAIKKIGRSTGF